MEMELFPRMSPRKRRKKARGKISKKNLIMICASVVIVIAGIVAYSVINQNRIARELEERLAAEEQLRRQQAIELAEYNQIINSKTCIEGVSVDGVSIAGMTLKEAQAALAPTVESYSPSGTLTLTDKEQTYSFDMSKIPASVNLDAVLTEAFALAKSGSYEEVKAVIEGVRTNGRNFTLAATYDFSAVAGEVAAIAAAINREGSDATIELSEDSGETPYVIKDEVVGRTVDEQALSALIISAAEEHKKESVAIPVNELVPAVTRAQLESSFKLRAKAETSFKGSTSNRIYNIKKGSGIINGTVLKPGEVFSCNDKLGVRTLKNGWKMAGAYVSGTVDEQAGGGVCQLSSTLYNAVVKADLEIVYRRNHSMPVSYLRNGLDATINSVGNIIDFKFKNNTGAAILIRSYVNGKSVFFEIYGLPFATDEYDEIRLSSEKIADLKPEGEPTSSFDPTLMPGEEVIKVARQNGSIWQSYKNYYKAGELVRSNKLAQSTYVAFDGLTLIGPTPTPTPPGFVTPGPQGDAQFDPNAEQTPPMGDQWSPAAQ